MYIYVCACIIESLCCTAEIKHNIINQLYFNKLETKLAWLQAPSLNATLQVALRAAVRRPQPTTLLSLRVLLAPPLPVNLPEC